MAQQTINNGESGLVVRQKINAMFSEVYSGIPAIPVILRNYSGAQTYTFTSNSFVNYIFVKKISGTCTIKIGTTIGGSELADTTDITATQPFLIQQPYNLNDAIYFTISGVVDIRIDLIPSLL